MIEPSWMEGRKTRGGKQKWRVLTVGTCQGLPPPAWGSDFVRIAVGREPGSAQGHFFAQGVRAILAQGERSFAVQGGNFVQGRNFREGQHGDVGTQEIHHARPGEADGDVAEHGGASHARGDRAQEGGNESANADGDHRRDVPDAEQAEDHAAADLQGDERGGLEPGPDSGAARIAADAAADLAGGGADPLDDGTRPGAVLHLRRGGVLAGATAAGLVGGRLGLAAESEGHGGIPRLGVQEHGFSCHAPKLSPTKEKREGIVP